MYFFTLLSCSHAENNGSFVAEKKNQDFGYDELDKRVLYVRGCFHLFINLKHYTSYYKQPACLYLRLY